jgi:glucose/arabinose dehydrogenase
MSKMILALLALLAAVLISGLPADALPLDKIKLPPGFKIALYAEGLPGARSMTLSPGGILYVGSRDEGNVYAIPDYDKDSRGDHVVTIARGLSWPNGVAFKDKSLYVAEHKRVIRFDAIDSRLLNPPKPVVVNQDFPKDRSHGWKYMAFGPDGWLYVPVGAPCNICDPGDPYASIMRMKPDGSSLQVFARGIRNSVGFDWNPADNTLWFTDNGRDWLGDDRPPDELNHAARTGMHFGYPYCHGDNISDPDFGKKRKCSEFTPPVVQLGPHVAALGMKFYTGKMFPQKYKNQIFIAEHGSWNRSRPLGYRIMLVRLKDGAPPTYEPFAEGWLSGGGVWGRPVDILVMPDGALLVSDDKAGAIYRISWSP